MTKTLILLWVGFGLATSAIGQVCKGPLSPKLMTVQSVDTSKDSRSAYDNWLCTTEFSSSQEAQDAGIDIGVPVYGVPLKLGATYSKSQRSEWKKTHCESQVGSSEYAEKLQTYLKFANPKHGPFAIK